MIEQDCAFPNHGVAPTVSKILRDRDVEVEDVDVLGSLELLL